VLDPVNIVIDIVNTHNFQCIWHSMFVYTVYIYVYGQGQIQGQPNQLCSQLSRHWHPD